MLGAEAIDSMMWQTWVTPVLDTASTLGSTSINTWINLITGVAGATVVLMMVAFAFLRGWVVTGKAADQREAVMMNQLDDMRKQRDDALATLKQSNENSQMAALATQQGTLLLREILKNHVLPPGDLGGS